MRFLLLLLAVPLLSGCRTHVLEDGVYDFALAETLKDECGALATPTLMSNGALKTTGNLVELTWAFNDTRLVGAYRRGLEELVLDGTSVSVRHSLGGRDCLVDTVATHLEAVDVTPSSFAGTMSVRFQARTPDECNCEAWLKLTGTRRAGP